MRRRGRFTSSLAFFALAVATALALVADSATADIVGFGDFSGFTINQGDELAAPLVSPGSIRLTDQTELESRSIFHNTPQNVSAFTASFTYRTAGTPPAGTVQGATFVMQNSSLGTHAVADANFLGVFTRFGYSDFFARFDQSIAVSLENGSLVGGSSSTDLYVDGIVENNSASTIPVNLFSGNPIRVSLAYDGSLLRETLIDSVTLASFETSYAVDFPSMVGNSTAYVGFTASNGVANPGLEQHFSDFQFVSTVPEPSSVCLALIGTGAMIGLHYRRRKARTDKKRS